MGATPDPIVAAFARVLQKRRRERGLSQEELAHRAGLSTSYVSLLENRRRQPTLTVLAALARELDVSAGELVGLVEDQRDGR